MGRLYQNFKRNLKDKGIWLLVIFLIFLFLLVYLSPRIFITIYPGEAGVLWSRFFGGTQIDYVYPEGLHYIFPWDILYIYNMRVQQTAHNFDVLTVNGLRINLSISIRYFPEYKLLGVLHQKVGPDYVEKVVIPEIESVLRVIIGRLTAEQVYTTGEALIEKSLNQAVEQIAQRFINVDNVIIKRVEFPPFVAQAIENKIEQKQLAAAQFFKIEREEYEKERKQIEAEGFRRYNEILAQSLSDRILLWRSIQATLELARSTNAKVVVIGSGENGLPLIGNIPLEPFQNVSSFDISEPLVSPEVFSESESSLTPEIDGEPVGDTGYSEDPAPPAPPLEPVVDTSSSENRDQ